MGDSMYNTHCVSEDMYVYLPQLGTMMRDSMSNALRHMCV